MKLKTTTALAALACLAALSTTQAQAQSQGVSKTEITLGSIQDLSGPLAGFGKQIRFGMTLRVNEINEQGGVNGRKIKLIVEDSGYDPKKPCWQRRNWSTRTRYLPWWATWARRRTSPPCRCSLKKTSSTFFR